jgi:glycolate oxidase FAD binding subunit
VTAWAEIVGPSHVAAGGPDDAVDGRVPAWVVRPGSVAEVQACVAAAGAGRMALVASGLGAHLDVGGAPARLDLLLRLDRMASVCDHQPGDMTVTVEAGCTLAALAAALAPSGQWLPIDPPHPAATTVGGLLAADLSGPLRTSQGRARDLVIGLRVVAADGALVAGGGRVVKNVAGYDLPKLHIGALGTVGVIVEATFKVRPRPEREEGVVVACPTVGAAAETAGVILDSHAAPLWLEVGGPGALAEGPGEGAAVAVGLGGIIEEIAHARALVERLARSRGLRAVAVSDGAGLRARLAAFAGEPAAAVLRVSGLPADVGAMLEAATAAGRSAGSAIRCLATAASGVMRAAVGEARAVAPLVRALRPTLAARGGTVVVERALPAVKAELDVWGDPGSGLALMRRVKAAFDPAGTFAPGRFVGGL